MLGRPHPPVVRAATSRLDIPRPRVFVRATSTPPRSIPRGRYRLGGACTASPFPAASETSREIADCLSTRAKATSGGRTDAFVADPPSPRDVPNVSQTCHADATPRGLAESQRRVRAGLTRRREPTRRVSRGRRGARKARESDAWLIATESPVMCLVDDVGSGDDQDGTDGGDDETKRCVNGFCSRIARAIRRVNTSRRAWRAVPGAPVDRTSATRETFFTTRTR